jgi:hypothetical protein
MSLAVPGRSTVLAASLVFDLASVTLLIVLLDIHGYIKLDPPGSSKALDAVNCISTISWFVGFVLLIEWIVFETFVVWGPSRRALIGAALKLIASTFFCVQPFSDSLGYLNNLHPSSAGVPWSNFVGILFFHIGNTVDALGMTQLFSSNASLVANLPVIGMYTFWLATWLLAIADGLYFVQLDVPWGPGADIGSANDFIKPGQILGAVFLLLGSLMYTVWSAVHDRQPAAAEPLTSILPINAQSGASSPRGGNGQAEGPWLRGNISYTTK